MPLLSDAELAKFPEPTTQTVVPNYVARYLDMMALADRQPARVIGDGAMLQDQTGFDIEFLTRGSIPDAPYTNTAHEVLMVMRGHWTVTWADGTKTLAPGDTCAVPPGLAHAIAPSMTGEASLFRVTATDDPAGLTQGFPGGHS
jgi:mannose-6-phosphate isomerase-like protein (cupin superfamily)